MYVYKGKGEILQERISIGTLIIHYSQKVKRGEQEEGWRRRQGGEDGQPGLLDTLYFTFHAISKP